MRAEIARDGLLLVLFTLALWAPLGGWIVRRLGCDHPQAPLPARISLGMAAWGMLILALGLAGLLRPSIVSAAALVIVGWLAASRRPGVRHAEPLERETLQEKIALCGLGLLSGCCIALAAASSLAPETAFDSLNVHLPYARQAAQARRAGFEPNNWSSVMPALPLMSYITAFVFSGVRLAKLVNLVCYILAGACVYGFLRQPWGRMRALAAALLFWSSPVALYEATTALIDLPFALFSAVCTLALIRWTRSGERPWLRLSAAALGFALGCKYHAAFWLAPVLAVAGWHMRRRLEWRWGRIASSLAAYTATAALLFLPWALRAWIYTGNPVFPAANEVFQSPYFTPAMAEAASAAYANEGIGTSPGALLRLPWAVTFEPGPFRGTLGFVFLPGVLLALRRGLPREVRYALALALPYFVAWALSAQEIRYLLPLLPLLAMVASAAFLGAPAPAARQEPGGAGRQPVWRIAVGLSILTAAALTAVPPWYARLVPGWTYWHSFQSPFPYLAGRQTAREYVQRDVPSIYVHEYANARLSARDRILLLNDAARFYSQVPTLGGFTIESERILHERSEEGLLARMRESGITHVLLNYNGIKPIPGVAPRLGVYFFLDRNFRERCLEEVYTANNVTLYRVSYPAGPTLLAGRQQ